MSLPLALVGDRCDDRVLIAAGIHVVLILRNLPVHRVINAGVETNTRAGDGRCSTCPPIVRVQAVRIQAVAHWLGAGQRQGTGVSHLSRAVRGAVTGAGIQGNRVGRAF